MISNINEAICLFAFLLFVVEKKKEPFCTAHANLFSTWELFPDVAFEFSLNFLSSQAKSLSVCLSRSLVRNNLFFSFLCFEDFSAEKFSTFYQRFINYIRNFLNFFAFFILIFLFLPFPFCFPNGSSYSSLISMNSNGVFVVD